MSQERNSSGLVERYLRLGLSVGRHIDGYVDAYYGPEELAARVAAESAREPAALVDTARRLIASIDAGEPFGEPGEADPVEGASLDDARRRAWLRSQAIGVLTTARILSGESVSYSDEVEACYGVRPRRLDEGAVEAAHRDLDEVTPGSGPLSDRLIAWREAQVIPPDKVSSVVASLSDDLRERTNRLFGLPEGEEIDYEYVTNRPWQGFNYYLGNLRSRVAINLDLPILTTEIAHTVAHESYPGHHTEHSRKEVGLVRRRRCYEESIFLVGTPQCLVSEGLADLGLEIVVGERPEPTVASHLRPLGIPYDPDTVSVIRQASEVLSAVRSEAALRLHEDGVDPDQVIDDVSRMALQPPRRAAKLVEFLCDSTWRAYITTYVEGLPLCRTFSRGSSERFERLITEQMTPAELLDAA